MGHRTSVLVFDDDELIGQTICNLGAYYQLVVTYTASLDAFWQYLETSQPDFILLDLLMPQCDGVQVAAELAKKKITSNIIITSGLSNRVLEAAARSASAQNLNVVGILKKPFSPKQFRSILDAHSGKQPDRLLTKKLLTTKSPQVATDDIVARLKKAVVNDSLTFELQPKIDCRTTRIKGFEVLTRWHDSELGRVAPDIFIAIAEKSDLINALTLNICKKAMAWFSEFIASQRVTDNEYTKDIQLAINISAVSLVKEDVANHIELLCFEHNISPENITLELTETAAMDEPIRTLDILTRLRMKGFNLSIDDFGTGYSSMLQLVRLPFSELKIDQSFISTAMEARESKVVIKAIIELAHSLDLHTVAEGVENEEVLDYIRELGCNEAQGYLIARPLAPAQISHWLQARKTNKEHIRLSTLKSFNILDTPDEYRFDRITRLASRLFTLPTSVISLIDEHRQWFKATTGMALKETKRSEAFCNHTIRQNSVLVVNDTLKDPRFAENPFVIKEPFVRFYAGYPIFSPEGEVLGALCVMDIQPRQFNEYDIEMLKDLAAMVEKEIAITSELANDFLTGVLNRKTFESRVSELNRFCQKDDFTLYMLYLDLDDFKVINDHYGHQTGDKVLNLFAKTLTQTFRNSDLIARIGGDEFVVAMVNNSAINIDATLQRLSSTLSLETVSAGLPTINYSFGLSVSTKQHPLTIQQLYEQADIAMYQQKRGKKATERSG